jgi:hypothetical protein
MVKAPVFGYPLVGVTVSRRTRRRRQENRCERDQWIEYVVFPLIPGPRPQSLETVFLVD